MKTKCECWSWLASNVEPYTNCPVQSYFYATQQSALDGRIPAKEKNLKEKI